jgi:hypothetical protein
MIVADAFLATGKGNMSVVIHPPKLPNPKEIEKAALDKPKKKPTFVIDKKPI